MIVKIKKLTQLAGDRGFYAIGFIEQYHFKAHLQPAGWKPQNWVIKHFPELETLSEVTRAALLQKEVLSFLNTNYASPKEDIITDKEVLHARAKM